ncbi:hypothetical protein GCM10018780_82020 [Streptomyces lanatus]|nr:hypothetical protein GCM10018780_82020 [Streptomyces lanatus]
MAAAQLLKIDILGLSILAALHTACDLIAEHHGISLDMASIPQDDPDVYAMIAAGRTIGVFQADSVSSPGVLPFRSYRRRSPHFGPRGLASRSLCQAGGSESGAVADQLLAEAGHRLGRPCTRIEREIVAVTEDADLPVALSRQSRMGFMHGAG